MKGLKYITKVSVKFAVMLLAIILLPINILLMLLTEGTRSTAGAVCDIPRDLKEELEWVFKND